jgi:D-glycero-alpha-D-manno-heptose-7-phosphate kinase
VGGGTDFEDFYRRYPGRVLSTSIDKYIFIAVNSKFDGKIRVSYSKTENVEDRNEIQHNIVKAVLEETGIEKGIEIVSVADIPSQGTGLGSSSSFAVGLLNAIFHYQNKSISANDLAEMACRVEINKILSPIGKQDQYIASFGGLNIINFNIDGKIDVTPVQIAQEIKKDFQKNILLFYTGVQRSSQPILSEQKENIDKKFEFLKKISDLVIPFKEVLERGDFKKAGEILNQNWLMKKELSSGVSNSLIDQMYQKALEAGAFGGKILGAGGGGFLLLIADPKDHDKIKQALPDYKPFSFNFTDEGSKIIFSN